MTLSLLTTSVRGILLDIEGATTPIDFVHEVLFSYARANVKNYLRENFYSPEVVADLAKLRNENALDVKQNLQPPALVDKSREAQIDSMVAYVNWLIDQDRKSTGLKSLQGKIWKQGYLDGTLKSQVFNDVVPALEHWCGAGLTISIFSSGSVLAQKLLFAHTEVGDLTGFISQYFDTAVGAKTDVESYHNIAKRLGIPAKHVLFISDVTAELDAASGAGMNVILCMRTGNQPQVTANQYQRIESFDEISME